MFDAPEFIEESIQQLKSTIDDVAIIACSGGVDSTVAAVIANKAVGDLLHCVYVDTGFMRKNETEEIEAMLAEQGINLITVKSRQIATSRHFKALLNPSKSGRSSVNYSSVSSKTSKRNVAQNTSSKAPSLLTGLNQVVVFVTPSSRIIT